MCWALYDCLSWNTLQVLWPCAFLCDCALSQTDCFCSVCQLTYARIASCTSSCTHPFVAYLMPRIACNIWSVPWHPVIVWRTASHVNAGMARASVKLCEVHRLQSFDIHWPSGLVWHLNTTTVSCQRSAWCIAQNPYVYKLPDLCLVSIVDPLWLVICSFSLLWYSWLFWSSSDSFAVMTHLHSTCLWNSNKGRCVCCSYWAWARP